MFKLSVWNSPLTQVTGGVQAFIITTVAEHHSIGLREVPVKHLKNCQYTSLSLPPAVTAVCALWIGQFAIRDWPYHFSWYSDKIQAMIQQSIAYLPCSSTVLHLIFIHSKISSFFKICPYFYSYSKKCDSLLNTHTQPFYGSVEFVRENPGEPVPEETFTHYSHRSHQSSLSAFSI